MPKKRYRDAETGHFVSKEEAKAHPATTVSEKIVPPVAKSAGFDLNRALEAISARITPEDREKDAEFQKKMRESLAPHLNPESMDARIKRARQNEAHLLAQIAALAPEPDSETKQNRLFNLLNR